MASLVISQTDLSLTKQSYWSCLLNPRRHGRRGRCFAVHVVLIVANIYGAAAAVDILDRSGQGVVIGRSSRCALRRRGVGGGSRDVGYRSFERPPEDIVTLLHRVVVARRRSLLPLGIICTSKRVKRGRHVHGRGGAVKVEVPPALRQARIRKVRRIEQLILHALRTPEIGVGSVVDLCCISVLVGGGSHDRAGTVPGHRSGQG